jgi:hypothetical protein
MVFSLGDAGPVGRMQPWDGADRGFSTSTLRELPKNVGGDATPYSQY